MSKESSPSPSSVNLGMTSLLNAAADTTPDHIATAMGDRTQSWSQLRERVARFASALKRLGVSADDRIAVLSLNSDRYTELYFASWWAGGAIVPMNLRWSVDENVYSLDDSETNILVVDDVFMPMAREIMAKAKTLKTVIHAGEAETPSSFLNYEALISENTPADDAARAGEDLAGLFYTGGTTGFPKGVMLPQRALWYNGVAAAKHLRLDSDTIYLHAAPMFHVADNAGGNGINAVGGRHVYVPSFTPDAVVETIESQGVTAALMVPTMIAMLLQSPAFDASRLSSLKTIPYGASPMPEGVLREAMERLPHVDFVQGYGQTEMAPLVTILPSDYHVLEGPKSGKLAAAGRPMVGCEIKIVSEDGEVCDYNEVGEIVAKSPGAMLGYWKLPEQTKKTLKDGWVHTGDGGYRDRDGFIFIVDRLKDMIVTGGEKVFSAEVESVISTHPSIAEVAVIGIPAKQWGEAVHAIVVPKPGSTVSDEEIIGHCRDKIANYKLPRSVSIRTTSLPLSGAGKVLKRNLREPYWKDKGRTVN
ncbi:MAG: long-chain-fatty-acid--CoA ligase [Pseudomonadota bacterium]